LHRKGQDRARQFTWAAAAAKMDRHFAELL
jgi:hypothetical protein